MWDLPGPGLEPVSPALAGGFLTTVPPGKSVFSPFNFLFGNLVNFSPQVSLAANFLYVCTQADERVLVKQKTKNGEPCCLTSLQSQVITL